MKSGLVRPPMIQLVDCRRVKKVTISNCVFAATRAAARLFRAISLTMPNPLSL